MVLNWIWEIWHPDQAGDDICFRLRLMGVEARMAARGEKIGGGGSLGLIDIGEGPIRWVNVRKLIGLGDPGDTERYTEYLVPDLRIASVLPQVRIWTEDARDRWFFGKVVGLRWKGHDSGFGILDRLRRDLSLNPPLLNGERVDIISTSYGCWILSTETHSGPSEAEWRCYSAIAEHLLAAPMPYRPSVPQEAGEEPM